MISFHRPYPYDGITAGDEPEQRLDQYDDHFRDESLVQVCTYTDTLAVQMRKGKSHYLVPPLLTEMQTIGILELSVPPDFNSIYGETSKVVLSINQSQQEPNRSEEIDEQRADKQTERAKK